MSLDISPAAVADGYELRARFARAESDAVPRPRLLRGLRRSTRHVAEVPCGADHFLTDYAAIGARTTLIDGNGAMLAFLPGYGGLSEIVAQTGNGDSR